VLLGGVTGLEQPLVAFADLLFDERRPPSDLLRPINQVE
jgi:hypothetical protein